MKNINRVTLVGRLTADPEQKVTSSGQKMATFGLATNFSWKDQSGKWKDGVDYHNIIAWRRIAEQVCAEFKKGEGVLIEGKIQTRSWSDDNGNKKRVTEIVASNVLPISSKTAKQKAEEIEKVIPEDTWEKVEEDVVVEVSSS